MREDGALAHSLDAGGVASTNRRGGDEHVRRQSVMPFARVTRVAGEAARLVLVDHNVLEAGVQRRS